MTMDLDNPKSKWTHPTLDLIKWISLELDIQNDEIQNTWIGLDSTACIPGHPLDGWTSILCSHLTFLPSSTRIPQWRSPSIPPPRSVGPQPMGRALPAPRAGCLWVGDVGWCHIIVHVYRSNAIVAPETCKVQGRADVEMWVERIVDLL